MSVLTTARGKVQDLSGRVKTAVGRKTGNRRMQASGYMDRAKGTAKQVPGKVKRTVK